MATAPVKPPPPPGRERRAAPRYEIVAQANVTSEDDVYLLTVLNLSAAGAFLEGKPSEHPKLGRGTAVELVLSCSDPSGGDEDVINIRCNGTVARVDEGGGPARPAGFGVAFQPLHGEESERLTQVIDALASRGKPLP